INHFRHFITSGGIGLSYLMIMMIISWIHTGRVLTSNIYTHLMVLFMILATVLRSVIPFYEEYSMQLYLWSSIVWVIPFVLYIKIFFGFLVRPRADGVKG
ncbi:MAG: NnrS family protein, partial [Campylobacterota bacterium]|nr:NnrS family protein [Campylobacterota bacterium]